MNKKLTSLLALVLVVVLGLFGLLPHDGSTLPESTGSPTIAATQAAAPTTEDIPEPTNSVTDAATESPVTETTSPTEAPASYTSKDEVALYIHLHGRLPDNFITKSQARALGWTGGSLESYAPGCCIGGDTFGNREGLLPDAPGRTWKECDIDTLGKGSRGAKRIVFSNDGLIYYTDDHYQSFELLYGEP